MKYEKVKMIWWGSDERVCIRVDKLKEMAHFSDLIKLYIMLRMKHGEVLLLLRTVDDTDNYVHAVQNHQSDPLQ